MNISKKINQIQKELNVIKREEKAKNNQCYLILNGYDGGIINNHLHYHSYTLLGNKMNVLTCENSCFDGLALTCLMAVNGIKNNKSWVVFTPKKLHKIYQQLNQIPVIGHIVAKQAKVGTVRLTPKLRKQIIWASEHD